MQETSLSLIDKARDGEESARNSLCSLYRPYIALIVRAAGITTAEDVDDIVQDTLLVVFERLPSFTRIRTGSLRRWLTVIARRKAAHFRQTRNKLSIDHIDLRAPELVYFDKLSSVLDTQEVLRALWQVVSSEISTQQLNIFDRSVMQQHATTEIASDLGISPNLVHLTRSRIMKKLRQAAIDIYGIDCLDN